MDTPPIPLLRPPSRASGHASTSLPPEAGERPHHPGEGDQPVAPTGEGKARLFSFGARVIRVRAGGGPGRCGVWGWGAERGRPNRATGRSGLREREEVNRSGQPLPESARPFDPAQDERIPPRGGDHPHPDPLPSRGLCTAIDRCTNNA